jgi:flagellar M-ring protein FliF
MVDQLQLLLGQLSLSRKIGIALGALASVLILVAFVAWAGRPDMQPAFTGLTTTNAAAISQALRTAKIPFQVADAGSTILVPAASLADARVAAGAVGTAADSTTTGFALFDKGGFGMSEFDQQVTYQRALEGKLTGTIQAMEGVKVATVSIVAAKTGAYAGQDQPATASVVVSMRNGLPPSPAMVRGIVNVVAGAVADLKPDNVTVVDESGRLLAGPQVDPAAEAASLQTTVERQLNAKVQSLVDLALGGGHSSVAVSATLDMNKVDQTTTTVQPINKDNWTPTSVQTSEERYDPSGGGASAQSNTPGLPTYPGTLPVAPAAPAGRAAPPQGPSSSASPAPATYVKSQQTVNYNNSQTVERVIKAPGAVQRLSVAVLIDKAAAGSLDLAGLQKSIAAAIGADVTRGDVVSVNAVPFATTAVAATAETSPAEVVGAVGGAAGNLVGGVAAAALLILVWRNVRFLQRRAEGMELTVSSPQQGLLDSYTSTGAQGQLASLAELDRSAQEKVEERLRLVASEKPDAIVGLMNDWLREDRR